MTVDPRPLTSSIGAVVPDVQLAAIDDADAGAIRAALGDHGVLVFPGQDLTPRATGREHPAVR